MDDITFDVAVRLNHHSRIAEKGCVEWSGYKDRDGYGTIQVNKVPRRAHRVAWEFVNGPAGGMSVCHACDNPSCINVDHLFLGTPADNMSDKMRKGRHRWAPNSRQKLTPQQVIEIRLSRARTSELAERFGVHGTTISHIRSGRRGAGTIALMGEQK